jgi:hypothetical protein
VRGELVLGDVEKQRKKSELLAQFPIGLLVISISEKAPKFLKNTQNPSSNNPWRLRDRCWKGYFWVF